MSLVSSHLSWTMCHHQGKNYMGLQGTESCWLQGQNSLSYWKYANLLHSSKKESNNLQLN